MNCPVCNLPCQETEDPGYYIQFLCYCKSPPPHKEATLPTFTAFIKSPRSPNSTYYFEFFFREPNQLHLAFSYGKFSIYYLNKWGNKDIILHGEEHLSPWEAYKLLKRYQRLKAFS